MTDEQNPGGQPQDPDAPLSFGQQPPTDPPPPPVNPYDQQPSAVTPTPSQPEQPAAPTYGEPAAPVYGQPQPPAYAGPAPAGAGYPVGAYPGAPVEQEPSKAMAITALVLSLLCCFPVGLILAIVVLFRSRDGRNHGKGLAIGAVVASIVSVLALVGGVYGLTQVDWNKLLPVEQLETGECINADNLTEDDEDFVENIEEVSCSTSHDAEVLATKTLTQDDARDYDPATSALCTELITEGGLGEKLGDLGYFGLTTSDSPNAGDKLVCIAYATDGTKLDAPL